ncbi:hypothetical protein PLEOSDRAFT_1107762 [Pleurotus ostreatus PC15]|uniref:Uncharacterized protein n=1 Tax=Pleurotus ostreatus (strain PC15) TaxID=1137138 RepID=A0A067ND30_PLEO1|nr:hypothetical protein PLEOSDRAFT_1107762 [Pleurotus ostreatus PC15]
MSSFEPRDLQLALRPPADTSFFYHDAFNVMNNVSQNWKDYDTGKIKLGDTIRWNVEIYMYGTGAPVFVVGDTGASVVNPKFKEDGGEIIILITHSGTITLADVQGHQIEYFNTVYGPRKPGDTFDVSIGVDVQGQYPETGNYVKEGSDYRYTISYEQKMPMFKNNGHEVFDFAAQYKDIYTLSKAQQSAELHNTYLNSGLRLDGNHTIGVSYPIHGLSVFRVSNLDVFPFDITFVHGIHGSYEHNHEERYMSGVPVNYKVDLNSLK